MATNPQIAVASLGLVPTIQGVRGNIATQLAGSSVMRGADAAGKSIGSRVAGTAMSALKTGLKVGGVVTAAVAGITLKGGMDRALGIEDAQAKMGGLGYATKDVEKIMSNALASVEGTSFGLDSAATTAAGAVAAGIKPGKELEGVLTTVANTAAATGGSLDEMGGIFNTVAAVGSAYTGDINMLAQRGVPMWQSLSDVLGVTQGEVRKMATEGKIDFETFSAAAELASGDVASAMGETTRGKFMNMGAAFSRVGATIVTGFLPIVKSAMGGITEVADAVNTRLGPIFESFFGQFGDTATAGVEDFFSNIADWILTVDLAPIGEFFKNVRGWVSGLDFSGFTAFFESLGDSMGGGGGGMGSSLAGIGTSLASIGSAAPELLASSLSLLNDVLGFMAEHSDVIITLLPFLVAGFVAFRISTEATTTALLAQRAAYIATLPLRVTSNALLLVANGLELANTRAKARNTVATTSNAAATTTSTIAERARNLAMRMSNITTRIAAVTTRAFGVALRFAMGPIGLIITGVTLLAAGLVYFFTQTEVGSRIWTSIWGWIKNAASAVVDWFTGTALPVLQAAWNGIAAGALWLYQNAILPAWSGIKTAISAVGTWITGTLWPALQTAWSAIGTAVMWLWQNIIQPAWTGIRIAIAVAVTAVLVYIDLLKWYFNNVIAPVALWLWHNVMQPAWNGIKTAIGAVVAWFRDTAWPILQAVIHWVANAATWLWQNVFVPVWNGIKGAISAVVAWFRDVAWPIVKSIIDFFALGFKNLYTFVIKPVWTWIRSAIDAVVQWFKNTAWPIAKSVIDFFALGFRNLYTFVILPVWNKIRSAINAVVAWFRDTAWPLVSGVIDRFKAGFQSMKDRLKVIWDAVKNNVIAPVANWFSDTLWPKIKGVTDNIKSAFDVMKNGVKKAWDGIKSAARVPAKFVVEDVYNDTIRSTFNGVAKKLGLDTRLPEGKIGFASGGVMPGYTPGRDVHQFYSPTGGRLDLSGGEAIMRPEWTRAVGGVAAVADMNRKARRGEAFAGGGVWDRVKGVGGDAWDWMKDKASTISEALSDPLGILTKLASKAASTIPGSGMVRDIVMQAGKNVGKWGGEWLKDKLFSSEVGGGTVPQVGAGSGGWGKASNAAAQLGLRMTSGYRGGSRTAGSGSVSMHALGRARDYAGSASAMSRFFDLMNSAPFPTELLYTPKYGRNIHRGGGRYANTGATARNHWDHVHVAFNQGGVFGEHAGLSGGKPYLYDKGGEIPPGVRVVANRTSRPEKVLPPAESEALTRLAKIGQSAETSSEVQLSAEDRELLRAIAEAADIKVDGRSIVRTVKNSFKSERTPIVTS